MSPIKLYGKLIRYRMMNRYIAEFILIYTSMLLNLSVVSGMIVLGFIISHKKEDKVYNFVSILPCKTKDIVKVKYISEYVPIVLAYIISGFILIIKGETVSYIYQMSIILASINIIIPVIKINGMKDEDNLVVSFLLSIIFLLDLGFYALRMTNDLRMMEDTVLLSLISLGIVVWTLRISYKRSLKNIYG